MNKSIGFALMLIGLFIGHAFSQPEPIQILQSVYDLEGGDEQPVTEPLISFDSKMDINLDGVIDSQDKYYVESLRIDLNGDGVYNDKDLNMIKLWMWLHPAPTATPTPVPTSTPY